jgi:hypothetical protein
MKSSSPTESSSSKTVETKEKENSSPTDHLSAEVDDDDSSVYSYTPSDEEDDLGFSPMNEASKERSDHTIQERFKNNNNNKSYKGSDPSGIPEIGRGPSVAAASTDVVAQHCVPRHLPSLGCFSRHGLPGARRAVFVRMRAAFSYVLLPYYCTAFPVEWIARI